MDKIQFSPPDSIEGNTSDGSRDRRLNGIVDNT